MGCSFCPIPHVPSLPLQHDQTTCDVLFVGEAPGMMEVRSGLAFQGPSGQLLQTTIKRVGISDTISIGFTNAVLCAQDGSKTKKFLPKCLDACRSRLIDELVQRQPKLIVALGTPAIDSLMNDKKLRITQCISQTFIQPETQTKIIPVVHPAAVLRSGSMFKDFDTGMRHLAAELTGMMPEGPGETKWMVADENNIGEILKYIEEKVNETHFVSADIETNGLKYVRGHRIKQIGLCFEKNKVIIFKEYRPNLLKYVNHILELPQETLSWGWWNGKFDCGFIRNNWKFHARVDEDMMLMHYSMDERKGTHDLEVRAIQDLGAGRYTEALAPYMPKKKESDTEIGTALLDSIPEQMLDEYHAKDCDYTWQLRHKYLDAHAKDEVIATAYKHVMIPGSEFLINLERRGIWVNPEYHDRVAKRMNTEIEEVTEKINAICLPYWDAQQYMLENEEVKNEPEFFNIGSPLQLKWMLFKRLGFRPAKGYGYNTQEETIASMISNQSMPHTFALPSYIMKFRELKKLNGTYVEGLYKHIESDGRAHSSYLIHGTVTGRLASRKPNMQNIPRDSAIRSLFQAPPGRILIECDYKASELRCLGYLSRDEEMARIFRSGLDLHDEMSDSIWGKGNWDKEQRVMAKTVNFGIPYGRGAYDLAMVFGIPVDEAAAMIASWFKRFPQAARYIHNLRDSVTHGAIINSPFGRKRRFHLTTSQLLNAQQNEAANMPISSMSADLTLLSGVDLDPLMDPFDTFCVNEIHDSIIFEAPERSYIDQARIIADVMRRKPLILPDGDFLPFDVEVKIGKAWGELEVLDLEAAA